MLRYVALYVALCYAKRNIAQHNAAPGAALNAALEPVPMLRSAQHNAASNAALNAAFGAYADVALDAT